MGRSENHIRVMHETAYAEYGSALEILSACKLSKRRISVLVIFTMQKMNITTRKLFYLSCPNMGKVSPQS